MPVKEWTVLFPTSLDSESNQPTIVNDDLGVPSQINSARNMCWQLENTSSYMSASYTAHTASYLTLSSSYSTLSSSYVTTTSSLAFMSASYTAHTASYLAVTGNIDNRLITLQNQSLYKYIQLAQPSGVTASVDALWQFDGSGTQFNDLSAGGHDLGKGGGTTIKSYDSGMVGLGFIGDSYYTASNDSTLHFLNDLTVEMQIQWYNSHTEAGHVIFACGNSGELATANFLYDLSIASQDNQLSSLWEHGAGTDSAYTFKALLPPSRIKHLVYRRLSNVVSIFLDGILIDSSGALTGPDGGANSVFVLGVSPGAASYLTATIFSMKITGDAFSDAQILEAYNLTRGV